MLSFIEIGNMNIDMRSLCINMGTVLGIIAILYFILKAERKERIKLFIVYFASLAVASLGSYIIGGIMYVGNDMDIQTSILNSEGVNFTGVVLAFTAIFLYYIDYYTKNQ